VPQPLVLVAFHSKDGQTAKIAARLGEVMREQGADCDVVDAADDPDPSGYDAVVVGDSIRNRRHSRSLIRFLRRHDATLATKTTALFQVSMTSAKDDPEHTAAALELVDKLVGDAGFQPNHVALFAGAVMYTKYGWLTRRIMRSISAKEGGSTDTSRDHEYTDWDAVVRFGREVYASVAGAKT